MGGEVPAGAVSGDVREAIFLGARTRVFVELHGALGVRIWADLPSEQAESFRPGCAALAA